MWGYCLLPPLCAHGAQRLRPSLASAVWTTPACVDRNPVWARMVAAGECNEKGTKSWQTHLFLREGSYWRHFFCIARRPRVDGPGVARHVPQRGYNRQPVLFAGRQPALLELLSRYTERSGVRVSGKTRWLITSTLSRRLSGSRLWVKRRGARTWSTPGAEPEQAPLRACPAEPVLVVPDGRDARTECLAIRRVEPGAGRPVWCGAG